MKKKNIFQIPFPIKMMSFTSLICTHLNFTKIPNKFKIKNPNIRIHVALDNRVITQKNKLF